MNVRHMIHAVPVVFFIWLLTGCFSDKPQSQAPLSDSKSTKSIAPNRLHGEDAGEALAEKPQKYVTNLSTADPAVSAPLGLAGNAGLKWNIRSGKSVRLNAFGLIDPLEPGISTLVAALPDESPVEWKVNVQEEVGIDFANDIQPILTRHGCNSGGCHGRLDGQNGFKLSLFGYAVEADYQAIVRQSDGRRVNLLDPAGSLLLQKAAGQIPHGGGQAISPQSGDFQRLLAWVAAGVSESDVKSRVLKNLKIVPDQIRVTRPESFTAMAIAEYDDGTTRDVSAWALWKSLDESVAGVDACGRARVQERGETAIVVRYGSLVNSVVVQFAGESLSDSAFEPLAGAGGIDKILASHLKRLGIGPSPLADDAMFLRRLSLDLVGRLPEPAEIRRFVKDPDPEKRAKMVDQLMDDADFNKLWSLRLGDLLQISSARQGNAAAFYLLWLQDQLDRRTSWDEVIRQLLTTRGDPATKNEAAAAYSLENNDPVLASQLAAQRFLGIRIRCAQCHDHPFDVFTQTQAHRFAAFFATVRPSQPMPGQMMTRPKVAYFPQGEHRHPLTGEKLEPAVLSGNQPPLKPDTDPLPALAAWITDQANPLMPRAMANWLWSQFFQSGLVSPVDDLSAANPPSHPELLDFLGQRFVKLGYQLRPMIREIVTSRAYQLSSQSTPENSKFARLNAFQAPRPLSAQQMADALAKATGVPNRFANKPTGIRAIDIQDPTTPSTLLETLGRCDRRESCGPASGTFSLSLRQSLLWIGSDTVDSRVGAVSGYLRQLMELSPSPAEVVENLYLRTLCRFPSTQETEHFSKQIETASDQAEVVEDLFWALINSREFLFNH